MPTNIRLEISDDVLLLLIRFMMLTEEEQTEILQVMEYGDDK